MYTCNQCSYFEGTAAFVDNNDDVMELLKSHDAIAVNVKCHEYHKD